MHLISASEYKEKHGQIKCEASFEAYSEQNKRNGDWIERANESGIDLTEYKKAMALSVSKSIMAKPEERKRRAKLLGDLNKTEAFRRKSSETAMATSTRPDIKEKRTKQLREWREKNPDDFYEKCVKKFSSCFNSKPETLLRKILDEAFEDYYFSKSILKSQEYFLSTKTRRRQLDAMSYEKRIIVEFDGQYHFKDDSERLVKTKQKDEELNDALPKLGYMLIRISYDQYSYRRGGTFSEECLKKLFDALRDPKPGVIKIGKAYKGEDSAQS